MLYNILSKAFIITILCIASLIGISFVRAMPPTGLADTIWPMYQRSPSHTGQSLFRGITGSPIVLAKHSFPYIGSADNATGMSVGTDGTVYIAALGILYALQPNTGQILWRISPGRGVESRSTPAVGQQGQLYWGFNDTFTTIASDGSTINSISGLTTNYVFGGSPVIAPNGTVYVVHDALWAFNPDGSVQWAYSFGSFVHTNVALGADGTIFAQANGSLYAFRSDGTLKWKSNTQLSGSPSIGSDGTIYIGGSPGELFAIAPDGTQKWVFLTDESTNSFSGAYVTPTIGTDGTIYFSTHVSGLLTLVAHIYAVNPDGSLKWKYTIPRGGNLNPGVLGAMVIDQDNDLFACADNGSCYALNANGSLLWEYVAGPKLWNRTAPLITQDGMIWLLDGSSTLHILADPAFPVLKAEPAQADFNTCDTPLKKEQTVQVTSLSQFVDSNPITWTTTISPNVDWLKISAEQSTLPSQLSVEINTDTLPTGVYTTAIQIQGELMSDTKISITVPVTLTAGCATILPTNTVSPTSPTSIPSDKKNTLYLPIAFNNR